MDSLMNEVDLLLLKIKSLPENEKELALSKIREQLTGGGSQTEDVVSKDPSGWVAVADNSQESGETESKGHGDHIVAGEFHGETQTELTKRDLKNFGVVEVLEEKRIKGKEESVLAFVDPFLQCDICGICLNDKASLRIHLQTHKKKTYKCCKCHKKFKTSGNLVVHMKRHENKRDFACPDCDYKSVTKIDLDRHYASIHSNAPDHICEFCGRTFLARRLLMKHIAVVHRKDQPILSCGHCPYVAKQKSNLKVHMQLKHFGGYNTHICPVCGAKVAVKAAFLEHLRAHTGEKPFQCDICSSSFASRGRLNAHKKSIHGPRQFDCTICSKKFPTKHNLQRHIDSHKDSKPHACPFCQFACNMPGNLTKHIRNTHNKPDFSMRDYKKMQNVVVNKDQKSWTEKGQKELGQYLNELSQKLGRQVTVQELRSQEEDKRKQMTAVFEKAKLDRINKINTKEHSYFQKPAPPPVTTLPHVLPNIYAEAIAAANLDFSAATMAELPNLLTDTGEGFCVDTSLIMPSDLTELRDPMLPNFTDMLPLGLENYSLPIMDAPNCFVQLPSGEKVQLSLQDQHMGSVELPILSHSDGVMHNEFLSATNTFMIVLAERSSDIMHGVEHHHLQ